MGQMKDPTIYGQSDLTYNDYLKVDGLINLQKPLSEPAHHDEMLFIITLHKNKTTVGIDIELFNN
jgi:tryptophan 2,3-dioxygenase